MQNGTIIESVEGGAPACTGSMILGTACGKCQRCKDRGFGPDRKEAAIKAERERAEQLPASRVKTALKDDIGIRPQRRIEEPNSIAALSSSEDAAPPQDTLCPDDPEHRDCTHHD